MAVNKIKSKINQDLRKNAVHYMKMLVDVAREPFIILDCDLRIITANPIFYDYFRVKPKDTVNKFFYDLGNGQWNIEVLKKLLEEILPKNKIVTNYEVRHKFQKIGEKFILINAKRIDSLQLIVLAMEDITTRRKLDEKMADYMKGLEAKVGERTKKLLTKIKELETLTKLMVGREIKMVELKKIIKTLRSR